MQMNTPFIYKSSPICCSHQLQVRYDGNVWEPKILDVGDKEESSKALQSKLEGIFSFEFY